jgi:cell division septation protein DedD
MSDDESRGLHLSDKQLVFAFMAAAVAAVVVFLFGVLVGRGVDRARGPISDVEMTAAEGQVVPDGPPEEGPAAGGSAAQESGGAGLDALSYPAQLGKTPPVERLKPVPPPVDDSPRALAPPEVPEDPVGRVPAAAAPAQAAAGPPAGTYTVQVAAVSRREEAEGIATHLKAKRYEAFVVPPGPGDNPAVYRVRIGSFTDKRKADMLAERLLREDKRYKPWVTR